MIGHLLSNAQAFLAGMPWRSGMLGIHEALVQLMPWRAG